MKKCSVPECDNNHLAKGLCSNHYELHRKYGRTHTIMRKRGSGTIKDGYTIFNGGGETRREHRVVAELALGRPLPDKAVVHHVDEDKSNNKSSNLVICPDRKYHFLLHVRMRAYDACGHADWLKCRHCKEYDSVNNLVIYKNNSPAHKQCSAAYSARIRHAKN